MALFKILRGGVDTLKNQPINDGWAYFTPEDGKFYIDVVGTVGGADYGTGVRVPIAGSGGSALILEHTLMASSWVNNTQSVSHDSLDGTYKAIVQLNESNDLDFSVMAAAAKADIKASIGEQIITFTANGNVPTVDIPIIIYIWEKEEE